MHEPFLPTPLVSFQPELTNTLVLGYWKIRGLAQHLRLLMAHTGIKFEEKSYFEDSRSLWFEGDKKTIKTPFPNLPYLKDGEFIITESTAIQRYIVRKSNNKELLGKNIQDSAKI